MTNGEIKAMAEGPWHHLPAPVSKLQLEQDQARCRLIAMQTPVDSTTPFVIQYAQWVAEINCMQALGYKPGAAPARTTARRKEGELQMAGAGVGSELCSEFNRVAVQPEFEGAFFSWAQGMISGWNLALIDDHHDQTVEMAGLTPEEQRAALRNFCRDNPSKKYIQAVIALMNRFRTARTGGLDRK
jgi:hypothetical protein